MQDDEVIRIANDLWLPSTVEARSWERGLERGLETVEGDVGEQGAHHASLRGARFGREERGAVEHAGRQPGSDCPPEGGEGVESGQQLGVVDTVEALRDVRVQH